ncbi:hypothetical protein JIG36_12395 [Actinoplanes sp. LDG1-06]|uniref:SHOCT domain-containing protein n=1 Tax=Paractinoplanes ovalisporus TaxID=2810368 RepID=A0ABS2A941_9ACTN|nr:hypothetical protein [Actinoplanes ovalisporus]MBM2616357.1 hypothetical protein [Actinoplanes ovalisporus]
MEALVLLAVALVLRVVGAVVTVLVRRLAHRTAQPPRVPDPCLASLWGLPPTASPDPERALLDHLLSGRLDREQYRAAMAELARRDESAHPLRE